ncbi:MAG: hypothetical protein ACPGZP_10185, partial [Panacagrimonas sp.]
MIHPAVRIVSLTMAAATLPQLSLPDLCLLFLLVAVLITVLNAADGRVLRTSLWRMKWLFAAVAVTYVGFTAGTPIHEWTPGLSRQGLLEGARRAMILALLIALVRLCLLGLDAQGIGGGLIWLLRPLRMFGWNVDRFGRRVGMTLEVVPEVQQWVRSAREKSEDSLTQAA